MAAAAAPMVRIFFSFFNRNHSFLFRVYKNTVLFIKTSPLLHRKKVVVAAAATVVVVAMVAVVTIESEVITTEATAEVKGKTRCPSGKLVT